LSYNDEWVLLALNNFELLIFFAELHRDCLIVLLIPLDFVVILEYDVLIVVYVGLVIEFHHRNIDVELFDRSNDSERVVREIDV